MERQDAIRKVRAMRNTNGRTPGEIESFKAMAAKMMAAHNLTEADVAEPRVFDFASMNWNTGTYEERSADEAEFVRKAREAAFWAAQAKRNEEAKAREARNAEWMRQQRENAFRQRQTKTRKSANRGPFTGHVNSNQVHPDEWKSFMFRNGLRTNGALASFMGVSSSLVSEWMGKGRGHLASRWQLEEAMRKAGEK